MDVVLLASLVVLVFGGMVAGKVHDARGLRRHWRKTATRLGFTFDRGSLLKNMSMQGSLDGIAVGVTLIQRGAGDTSVTYTAVEARPTVPLPAGLHIRHENLGTWFAKVLGGQDIPLADPRADEALRVRGDDPTAVQALLDHPAAEPTLHAIAQSTSEAYTRVEDGKVIFEVLGRGIDQIETLVRAAVDAVHGLDASAREPWRMLATERGLRHEETRKFATLDGTLRGLPVLIRARYSDEQAKTTFRVSLEGGPPRHVRIRVGTDGERIGDPILDGRIVVESTGKGSSEAAIGWFRDRLADEGRDLRGCLMDVLQGLPGAVVNSGAIHASLPGRPGPELADTVDRLIDLGVALSNTNLPPPTEGAHGRAPQPERATRQEG